VREHDPRERVVARLEMAITPEDLERLAPLLSEVGEVRLVRLDSVSAAGEERGGRSWRITMSKARPRSLGHLNLPLSDVEIELDGYDRAEAARFMERFHLVFRKGGG
jgi:hypothetical protein